MSGREIVYRPPRPVGDPFQGDPRDTPAFPSEGSAGEPPSAQQPDPAAAEAPPGAYVLPPDGATAGQIPPVSTFPPGSPAGRTRPPSLGDAPVFTKPGAGPVSGPHAAQPAGQPTEAARRARTALTIGLVSLLVLHIPLGPVAIVLGVKSVRAGESRTGAWAISAGVAGTLIGIAGAVLWATGNMPTLDQLMKGETK